MDNIVKEEIIAWISKPENEDLMEMLRLIKETSSSDWFDELNKEQKQSLQRGRKDHQEGDTLTNKEFWEKHAR